jgi:hypothetical protein
MPTIDANALQELIDQINTLRTEVKTTGDEGRNRLGGINVDGAIDRVPKDAGGKVDAAGWSATSEEKKKEIHQGLVQVRDSLHDAADLDGPAEPGHIMSADYASNAAIITWAVAGFLVTAGLLVGIVLFWGKATGTDFHTKIQAAAVAIDEWDAAQKEATTANEEVARVQLASTGAEEEKDRQEAQKTLGALLQKATAQHERAGKAAQQANLAAVDAVRAIKAGGASEDSVLLMVVLLGAFGGSLHLLRSLVKFVGNRQLKRSWLLYYLSTPLVGAGLASIVYMMLRIGLLGPSGGSANGSTNGSAIANLNLIAIYAFAALSGLFAETASNKLSEVFKTMFRTAERPSKDPVGAEQPPGTAVSAAR